MMKMDLAESCDFVGSFANLVTKLEAPHQFWGRFSDPPTEKGPTKNDILQQAQTGGRGGINYPKMEPGKM